MLAALRARSGRALALPLRAAGLARALSGEGGGDWRLKRAPEAPPKPAASSEDVHGALHEHEVTSKAMRRKLLRGGGVGGGTAAPEPPEPPQLPFPLASFAPPSAVRAAPQPAPGGPSFFQGMMSNMLMGAGMTLGFILVAAAFKAMFSAGGGSRAAPRAAAPQQAPYAESGFSFDLDRENDRPPPGSSVRI